MHCPACGADVVREALFCHKCGEQLETVGSHAADNRREASDQSPPPSPASRPEPTARERFQQAIGPHADDEPERQLWQGGYSARAMSGSWLLTVLATVAILVIWALWIPVRWYVPVGLVVLLWAYQLVAFATRHFGVRYTLTTRRFIHERGILHRLTNRIEVLDMADIVVEQGLMDRLLNLGTIRILSSDRTDPTLVLPGIENAREVAALLDDTRLAERRRRGIYVEQVNTQAGGGGR